MPVGQYETRPPSVTTSTSSIARNRKTSTSRTGSKRERDSSRPSLSRVPSSATCNFVMPLNQSSAGGGSPRGNLRSREQQRRRRRRRPRFDQARTPDDSARPPLHQPATSD